MGLVVAALAGAIGFTAGRRTSGIRRVSGQEFLVHVDPAVINSAESAELIGVTVERVYLERWSAMRFPGRERTVEWTPLSELPADVAGQLRAGTNPWAKKRLPSP